MSEEEDILLEAVERRLANLEKLLLGSDPAIASQASKVTSQQGHDISTRVTQLLKMWSMKEQEWNKDGSKDIKEEYEKIEREVDAAEEFSLDTASKLDIILDASHSTIAVGEKVGTFLSHQQYINSEAVGKVGELAVQMAPLETVHWEQVEDATQANALYHQLMESYNDTIQLLSKKFVFWDSLLKLAEQQARRK